MKQSNDKLFLDIKKDNYLAYNKLFTRLYNRLCIFVSGYTEDENASEDIVQELFIKLWTNRKQIYISKTISSYLYKSSKNAALNYLRSKKNRQKAISTLPQKELQTEDNFLEYEEFLIQVKVCIDALPERSKQIFIMSRIDGMKHTEIALQLNISVKTIKNQIWKSLQYIRSCLHGKQMI